MYKVGIIPKMIQKLDLSLILDTSTEICLIALVQEGKVKAERVFSHGNLLSKNFLPSIRELMEERGYSPADLTSLAVGVGPGSYTGTRMGVSVGKALGFGLNLPVKPFFSPLAFLPDDEGKFLFLIPTRPGPYFCLQGEQNSRGITILKRDLILESELVQFAHTVDYVIATGELPECLRGKKHLSPSLNTALLIKALSSTQSVSSADIRVEYLHTPA